MRWQYSPYTLPVAGVALLAAALAAFAWRRRDMPGARPFLGLCVALAWWTLSSAVQYASVEPWALLFWSQANYVGISAAVTCWVLLALEYTGRAARLGFGARALLAAFPPLTLTAVFTDPLHHLWWRRFDVVERGGLTSVVVERGPVFWAYYLWDVGLLLAGSVILLQGLARSPRVYRRQAQALLFAVTLPWVANLMYLLGVGPFTELDPTPFALGLSCVATGWALFRFGLLDLVPIARATVVEGLPDGVLVLDPLRRVVDVNPAARRILGTGQEVVGQPASAVFEAWPDLAAGGVDVVPREVRIGTDPPRHFEVLAPVLHDTAGDEVGSVVLLRDVTARKQAEAAVLQQNRYLAALLESSRVITAGLDLQAVLTNIATESARLVGGDPGGIGLVRGAEIVFERRYTRSGWEPHRQAYALGEGIAGHVAATGEPRIVNDVTVDPLVVAPERLLAEGVAGFLEAPIRDRAGAVVGVLDVHRPIDGPTFGPTELALLESLARQAAIAIENAALYGALEEKKAEIATSLQRIEELFVTEQSLTRRLQELDLMKTNFMIVTTHEMRTPLTVLLGYMDALEGGYLGAASPAQQEAFGVCRRSAERMIQSFGDILEMLQIGERRVALRVGFVDIVALLREVLAELAPFLEQRRQRVTVAAPEGLRKVEADRERIRLVLQNLVQNAIRFTPDECEILASVSGLSEGVQVTVEDPGVGIDASELGRIFEPFYTGADARHHHSGTFEFESRGVGLGLAIARGHVETHGGRIWAESPGRGCGSSFHLVLPYEAPYLEPDEPEE